MDREKDTVTIVKRLTAGGVWPPPEGRIDLPPHGVLRYRTVVTPTPAWIYRGGNHPVPDQVLRIDWNLTFVPDERPSFLRRLFRWRWGR